MYVLHQAKVRLSHLILLASFTPRGPGRAGKTFWTRLLLNMKCTFTPWELELTPNKYVPRSILMAKSLEAGFSVEMKVEVGPCFILPPTSIQRLQGLTQKSLQRLFPCDTSMVVIIDDRADVWEWSPNLIKVIPCSLMPL